MITIQAVSGDRIRITCSNPDECIVVRLYLESCGYFIQEYWQEGKPAAGLTLASKIQRITGWPTRFYDFTTAETEQEKRRVK